MTKNFNGRMVIFFIAFIVMLSSTNFVNSQKDSVKDINRKNNSQVPPYLQIGDILFCEWNHYNTDPCWDHTALYVGNNSFIEATPVGDGVVRLIQYDWFIKYTKEICFGTVISANQTICSNAVSFAISQLGKPYQYLNFYKPMINRSKDANENSEAWYCTELIWAAYYNQGIELDLKGLHIGPVMPAEICWDNDINMYTYNKLNEWHIGMYLNWISYVLKNPRNSDSKILL